MTMRKVAVLSNVTLAHAWSKCSNLNFVFVPYSTYESDLPTDTDQVVVLLNFDELYPDYVNCRLGGADECEDYVDRCSRLYTFIKGNTHASVLWFGAEDFCYHSYTHAMGHAALTDGKIDAINASVAQMLAESDTYLDLKLLIAQVGIRNAYDLRGKHRWSAPYSRTLLAAMAEEICKQDRICHGDTKKCLVLDCDNVLWGGILSEDGVANIRLDPAYLDLQRYLLFLYHHGVILAVCSKNDREDVLRVFRTRQDMLLKERHIAHFCASWSDKPSNLRAIANALNVGLESMVFLDDSPFEVEAVRAVLPEVTAICYNRDTVYTNFSCFSLPSRVDGEKVRRRTETYRTNEKREQLKRTASTYDEYLASLQMKLAVRVATEEELVRLAELTQRTNKCTNGTRYTVEELRRKMNRGYRLYTVTLSDRFSDLGIVGAIGIEGAVLELFSLSCRALGRGIEQQMLSFAEVEGVNKATFASAQKNDDLHGLIAARFDVICR